MRNRQRTLAIRFRSTFTRAMGFQLKWLRRFFLELPLSSHLIEDRESMKFSAMYSKMERWTQVIVTLEDRRIIVLSREISLMDDSKVYCDGTWRSRFEVIPTASASYASRVSAEISVVWSELPNSGFRIFELESVRCVARSESRTAFGIEHLQLQRQFPSSLGAVLPSSSK